MALSRQALFGKLNGTLFKSIESATTFCKLRGNPYVELVHWLHQLSQSGDSDLKRIIRHFNVDVEQWERDLTKALEQLPVGASSISDFSHYIELAIERAWIHATLEFADHKVRSSHLLLALLSTPELRRVTLGISSVLQNIPVEQLVDLLPAICQGSVEAGEAAYDGTELGAALPGEASGAIAETNGKSGLARYCSDLTRLARDGKLDPVLGREHEIRTMVDILLRRRQNNPLLTGEAGVGKTAVVEGLALAIVNGEVPPALAEVRLLSLDVGALLAGASMKGEFESRLKSVLEEATASVQPVIIFIDEVHTLVGAGGAAGTGDAANLLKPALARGALRTIGATTWSEYKKHIEKDPALTRRFQVLQVPEPEEAEATAMLRGLVAMLEKHHGVWIMDEAVSAAVKLSHRYIPARQLPDKAISLLDTACARVAVTLHAPPAPLQNLKFQIESARTELALMVKALVFGKGDQQQVSALEQKIGQLEQESKELEQRWEQERDLTQRVLAARQQLIADDVEQQAVAEVVLESLPQLEAQLVAMQQEQPLMQAEVNASVIAAIVADWTGIPVGQMLKDEIDAVLELPEHLSQRVIGQPAALDLISERIQTARANLGDPGKPIGVFMLVGPSGVGKTETALAIADKLYGGEQNLITINMSEYQEAHTVSSLKGAPPGYVGYGEGGVLTEAVRRKPYSVVLLDEVEKAHPDVHEVFYQVFDKGWMEDGEGRHIDFKNTVLLLTSNTGGELLAGLCEDPELIPDTEALREALQPELLKVFPAAFIGRVTVIPYLPLMLDTLERIVRLHLNKVCQRMLSHHNIQLDYSEEVVAHIVSRCPVAETGARMLISFIEQRILPGLSRYWLSQQNEVRKCTAISIVVEDNGFVYQPRY
ncbi:type VI secretion system ATPase TssH [Neisseriaceae bacterium TC5R-5]|nr:type VI secretion system ATPase TssH [Neisseriaceae bacterium TC5R-5]